MDKEPVKLRWYESPHRLDEITFETTISITHMNNILPFGASNIQPFMYHAGTRQITPMYSVNFIMNISSATIIWFAPFASYWKILPDGKYVSGLEIIQLLEWVTVTT